MKLVYETGSPSKGGPRKWKRLLKGPEVKLPSGKTWKIDEEFVKSQILQFQQLTKRGYTPPLLKEHKREGERYGAVVGIGGEMDENGVWSVDALLEHYELDAWEKVGLGAYDNVSGGWAPLIDDEGKKYEMALTEVSLVAAPHVKIDQDVSLAELQEGVRMDEILSQLSALDAKVEALMGQFQKPQDKDQSEDDSEDKDKDKDKEDMGEINLDALAEKLAEKLNLTLVKPEEKEEPEPKKEPEVDLDALAEKLAEKMSKGFRPQNVAPSATKPQDGDVVNLKESDLESYAKSKGVSVLALLADDKINIVEVQ